MIAWEYQDGSHAMENLTDNNKVLINGRHFSQQELDEVRAMIRMFPNISRRELIQTICENLEWITTTGKYKFDACQQLLTKIEAKEDIAILQKKGKTPARITPKTLAFSSRTDRGQEIETALSAIEPIQLKTVMDKEERSLWNEYVERYHQKGYKKPFGASQRYFILARVGHEEQIMGCLLFSASAWALKPRDQWIGWTQEDRSQRLHLIINNTRFLIFPWIKVKNLASKTLSLAAKQIRKDWQERYNYQPVLLETFVDTEHYLGTCYKAANWIQLAETAGRGRMDRYEERALSKKKIYVYPLISDFRDYLKGADRSDG